MDPCMDAIPQHFVGKWKVDRDELFEEFLTELGVNFIFRKLAKNVKPTSEVLVNGDEITVSLTTGFMTKRQTFKLNEEFDDTFLGEKRRVTATYGEEGLLWDMIPYDSKHKAMQHIRQVVDGELVLTLCVGQVRCKRYFKRLG